MNDAGSGHLPALLPVLSDNGTISTHLEESAMNDNRSTDQQPRHQEGHGATSGRQTPTAAGATARPGLPGLPAELVSSGDLAFRGHGCQVFQPANSDGWLMIRDQQGQVLEVHQDELTTPGARP